MLPTLIIRHRRENLKKCSLRGIESLAFLQFFTYPRDVLPDLSQCILLKVGAPVLCTKDRERPLLLIDGTWRLAEKIEKQCGATCFRSLPAHYRTAYPRRQPDCPNPESGLASIEALYLAHCILELPVAGLLDHYYWKEQFLALNDLLPCFTLMPPDHFVRVSL